MCASLPSHVDLIGERGEYGNELRWVLPLIKLELRFADAPASSVTNLANYYPFMANSAAASSHTTCHSMLMLHEAASA